MVNMMDKTSLPEYGVWVWCHGSDCWGDWKVKGKLIPFSLPHKRSLPHRFVNENSERIHFVESWSEYNA